MIKLWFSKIWFVPATIVIRGIQIGKYYRCLNLFTVWVCREYILIIHLPKDCATLFAIDWEQNMKTYRNPIIERKTRLSSMGNFHGIKWSDLNVLTQIATGIRNWYIALNPKYWTFIEHLMNLEMDSTIILFNISHKILHFQIIRNFVVTYHWLFRNINKSLNFIHIQINNVWLHRNSFHAK